MNETTRRSMVQSALRTAALGAAVNTSISRVLGANGKVNVAVVGVGGRGTDHLEEYVQIDGFHVAAVVDVNQAAQEKAQALVQKARGHKPKAYYDMREAFADRSIDAVSIATPNHWHVLAAIWAVQAGKDVYVEKPVSHNIWEGQQLVAAARKHGRIVQVGQQSRSTPHKIRAMELLREGAIGKLYMAKGLCYKRRKSIGRKPDLASPPAGVQWDVFLGPAPLRPFNENRFIYNWHWFWDTGNGDIGNQGVHEMDVALWGLGVQQLPDRAFCIGGKFVYEDDQETPNTQSALFHLPGMELQFEVRGLLTRGEGGLEAEGGGNVVGDLFFGSEGSMAVSGGGFKVFKGETRELAMDVRRERGRSETALHMENFLAAVKSRKHTDLHCDVEVAARSAAYCHLANISYRLGRGLSLDVPAGRFLNDPEANGMLTRNYRAPYVVPRIA